MVPVLVALMAWAFATYLMLKGVKKIVAVSFPVALLIGAGGGRLSSIWSCGPTSRA